MSTKYTNEDLEPDDHMTYNEFCNWRCVLNKRLNAIEGYLLSGHKTKAEERFSDLVAWVVEETDIV